MTKKQEQLLRETCEKLDRHHEDSIQTQVHLKAIYNLLLRTLDRIFSIDNDED
jgi:hypothetical protein